jgi:tRNA dimethylallyltransferase
MNGVLGEKIQRASRAGYFRPKELMVPIDQQQKQPKMVFVAGPTGCGKTALSLLLADGLQGEIVSADSMQVYQGMDIGTAKPTLLERARLPHHLIDICDVSHPFSVVDFYSAAQDAISDIQSRGKVPIIVGGCGFYLHSLLYGPPAGPPSVPEVRARLESEMEHRGADILFRRLRDLDPDYAATITVNDRHKIIRALEIITLTSQPVSAFSWKLRGPQLTGPYRAWFIHRPRATLYERVEERCDHMIEEGLIQETEELLKKGLRTNPSACQAIGYRQAIEYLDSPRTDADFAAFVASFKKASRRYVKRQFTWFRREPLFRWIDIEVHDMEVLVDMMIQDCRML